MTAELPGRPQARKRVLLLTKYGRRAASTRFRFLQYLPFFAEAGLDVVMRPLLGDAYLARTMDRGESARGAAFKGLLARAWCLRDVRDFALVVVYLEAMPYLPPVFERLLGRMGVPYVHDLDDAVFHQYHESASWLVRRTLSRKIERVIAGATLVTAGNDYLASYACQFNPRVTVVPTVVDVNQFTPAQKHDGQSPVVIGWIGSPSTALYLTERRTLWETVTASPRCSLRVVGTGAVPLGIDRIDARPWREDTEVAEVRDFDIGVMPLRDDRWSRGKCGFKLIEYLACGLPVVASPVGVNARIVCEGQSGYLCTTDEEWVARLTQLIDDPALRRAMGQYGRDLVRERWSLQRWGPEVAGLFASAANGVA
jgi:glycosyltransferase involved in cell wall biosynthesis